MMWLWCTIGCTEAPTSPSSLQRFPTRQIQVESKQYTVEFACKEHEVALGLRYRTLKENEGVILCATSGSVTMKKMKSPISVAFVSSDKKILSVHDLRLEASDLPIVPHTKWVWEMPKGWFTQNRIHEGMQIDGL